MERSYSQMDNDTIQASVTALHGSVCGADLDYLNSSTPKVATGGTQHPLVANPGWERIKKRKKM